MITTILDLLCAEQDQMQQRPQMDPIGVCLLLSLLLTFGYIDDLYPHLPSIPSLQIWSNPNTWRSGMATESGSPQARWCLDQARERGLLQCGHRHQFKQAPYIFLKHCSRHMGLWYCAQLVLLHEWHAGVVITHWASNGIFLIGFLRWANVPTSPISY